MKYALSFVVGLAVGVAVALGLIYVNPLTQGQAANGAASSWNLSFDYASRESWLSTHDKSLQIPIVPGGAPLLWEKGVKGAILTSMPLSDGDTRAAGTRISIPSTSTELIRSGILVDDLWLISIPGSGSLFVHAVNNEWPLLRDTIVNVDWLGKTFSAPSKYGPTIGPSSRGASVVGLTGEFRDAQGYAREARSLDAYDGSFAPLSGQLQIRLED